MILNHNSLSAKLYRWFYGTNTMPTNLCPYFWKLVTAYLFALPLLILTLPAVIIHQEDADSVPTRIINSLLLYVMLASILSMLSVFGLFFAIPKSDTFYFNVIVCGFTFWGVGIVVGVVYAINKAHEKWKDYRYYKRHSMANPKQPKVNIVVEMVKAKYHKYCPKIDWKK